MIFLVHCELPSLFFFSLSESSSGYRDASIPSKYAKNVQLYFILLN